MKLKLLNGCSCSVLAVTPQNWHTKAAKVTIKWCISYRFYDRRYSKPKQIRLRGMNDFKTLAERQAECERLLKSELQRLKDGFNPFNVINPTKLIVEQGVSKERTISHEKISI